MLYKELEQGDILAEVRFGLALLAYADILLYSMWAMHKIRHTPAPKVVAYIVSVLVKLGDLRASAPLRELRATYQAIEPKTEWIYAVIGQCNLAIATLEQAEVIS